VRELTGEHRLRERILQALLNRALERTRPVDRIESGLAETVRAMRSEAA